MEILNVIFLLIQGIVISGKALPGYFINKNKSVSLPMEKAYYIE